jgi:hypothetical protein
VKDQFTSTDGEAVGCKRPPTATRFAKGRSGNPRGRPKNQRREVPYDVVLGQMVTIREGGRERRVTAAEAFILQLTRKGLQGDSSSARASLAAIETARASRSMPGVNGITRFVISSYGVGYVLRILGMAIKLSPLDKQRVRWEIQPWIVQAALDRLGDRSLTPEEQREVWSVTRTPAKVTWPTWWIYWG